LCLLTKRLGYLAKRIIAKTAVPPSSVVEMWFALFSPVENRMGRLVLVCRDLAHLT